MKFRYIYENILMAKQGDSIYAPGEVKLALKLFLRNKKAH
jgi:hypothetical protein